MYMRSEQTEQGQTAEMAEIGIEPHATAIAHIITPTSHTELKGLGLENIRNLYKMVPYATNELYSQRPSIRAVSPQEWTA
ncbi:hypothetical protein ColTof4_07164 [Colletotrichum tofieldiae]|nr:hypothetical protein ColTof3_12106 [Colletotrichum tofieldiae]GKT74741.1 hypothetical protein ColTof4_07164 [Colletotrichum tofieldiae]